MSWTVNKTYHSGKLAFLATVVAFWSYRISQGNFAAFTFVEGSVCVSNPDGNSSFELLTVCASPDSCQCLNQSCLAVINMTLCTNVYTWLVSIFFYIPIRKSFFPVQK